MQTWNHIQRHTVLEQENSQKLFFRRTVSRFRWRMKLISTLPKWTLLEKFQIFISDNPKVLFI